MWSHALLRQLAKPACEQTRARERASGDRIRATRRALVILLSGRHVRGVLSFGGSAIDHAVPNCECGMPRVPVFSLMYAAQ